MFKKETITATGATDARSLKRDERLTFASKGDAADYILTAEVRLTEAGNWFPAQVMTDNTIYSTVTGALEIRFNCTDLGTATTIDIEASGANL